jgi:heat shock protein HtpX
MIFGGYGGGRDRDNRGSAVGMILTMLLAPVAAMMLQLGLSRQREYAADAAGARLVGQQYGLISALKKLGAYNQKIPMNVPPTTAALFIVKPLSAGSVLSGLFSTHPPLAERISELEHMTIVR